MSPFFFFWGMSLMTNIWLNDSAELAWCLFFVMSYNSCLASLPISLSYFSKTHDLFTYLHGFSYFWIFKFLNLLSLPIPFLDLESLDRPPNTPPPPPHRMADHLVIFLTESFMILPYTCWETIQWTSNSIIWVFHYECLWWTYFHWFICINCIKIHILRKSEALKNCV